MRFDWDTAKAERNRRKHGVLFEEAAEMFYDPAMTTPAFDLAHSHIEDRWIVVGRSSKQRLLLVIYTERQENGELTVRIISARKTTPNEASHYGQS